METYQIILCAVFIILTIIGYFFDKKEDEPLKEKITYYRKPIMSVLLLSSLLLCLSSGIVVFSWAYQSEENDQIVNGLLANSEIVQKVEEAKPSTTTEVKENYETVKVNFGYLKGINPDTVAWLEVEGTNINYPVVQTTDNSYYLKHSYEKEKNSSGWVFADYRNIVDGTDTNLIIYGHNRINGTMFGTLKKAITKSWVEKSDTHIIKLITKDYVIRYQIFSGYTIREEGYYLRTSFKSLNYGEFVTTLLNRSKYNFNNNVNSEDKILTLSTCSTSSSKRIVVHAKMISMTKHK